MAYCNFCSFSFQFHVLQKVFKVHIFTHFHDNQFHNSKSTLFSVPPTKKKKKKKKLKKKKKKKKIKKKTHNLKHLKKTISKLRLNLATITLKMHLGKFSERDIRDETLSDTKV